MEVPLRPIVSGEKDLEIAGGRTSVTTVALACTAGTKSPLESTALFTVAVFCEGLQDPFTVKVTSTETEDPTPKGPRLLQRIDPPPPVVAGVEDLNSMQNAL